MALMNEIPPSARRYVEQLTRAPDNYSVWAPEAQDLHIDGKAMRSLQDGQWLDGVLIEYYVRMLRRHSLFHLIGPYKQLEGFVPQVQSNIYLCVVHVNNNHYVTLTCTREQTGWIVVIYDALGTVQVDNPDIVKFVKNLNRKNEAVTCRLGILHYDQQNNYDCGPLSVILLRYMALNMFQQKTEIQSQRASSYRQLIAYEIMQGRLYFQEYARLGSR